MRARHWVYRVALVFLWLVPVGLGAELLAQGAAWWVDHYNPYVIAQRTTSTNTDAPMQPAGENAVVLNKEEIVPWDVPAGGVPEGTRQSTESSETTARTDTERLLGFDTLRAMLDVEERQRQYTSFLDLAEGDRELFAVMHNAAILVYSADRQLRKIYGNNLSVMTLNAMAESNRIKNAVIGKQLIEDTAQKALQAGTAQRKTVAGEFDAVCLPETNDKAFGRCAYVFVSSDNDALLNQRPPDSPWEIPLVRYKKNLRHAYSGLNVPLDTNNYGFRGPDVHVPKPAGVFRIVCVGGSTTEEGITAETTYPALLETQLAAFFPGKCIEVVNGGTSGLETQGQLARLRDYLELDPDLMILYEGVNDIRTYGTLATLLDGHPCLGMAAKSQWLRKTLVRYLLPSEEAVLRRVGSVAYFNLDHFQRMARDRGVRVALCSLACPDYAHIPRVERQFFDHDLRTGMLPLPLYDLRRYVEIVRRYNAGLRDLCSRRGIQYIPVGENISAGVVYFNDVCHMKQEGILRKATIIAEYIKEYIRPALQAK